MKWEPSKTHFQFITSVPFTHDEKTNVDYYLEKQGDTLICLFQPTNDSKDWKSDFDFFPRRFNIYPGSNIQAHEGIARQYLGMRSLFLDMAYMPEIKKIHIAGFSLGGGLSQLACEDAAYHFPDKEVVSISYEGPRVFCLNKAVRKLLEGRQILVKTWWDPVVHVPFKIMALLPWKINLHPFRINFFKPGISIWADYGKKVWIGHWYRPWPLQHFPEQIEKNLFEKFGG